MYWFARRPGTGWEKKHVERAERHRAEVEASGLVHLNAFGSGSGGLVLWGWVQLGGGASLARSRLVWAGLLSRDALGSCHGLSWALAMEWAEFWPWDR